MGHASVTSLKVRVVRKLSMHRRKGAYVQLVYKLEQWSQYGLKYRCEFEELSRQIFSTMAEL